MASAVVIELELEYISSFICARRGVYARSGCVSESKKKKKRKIRQRRRERNIFNIVAADTVKSKSVQNERNQLINVNNYVVFLALA